MDHLKRRKYNADTVIVPYRIYLILFLFLCSALFSACATPPVRDIAYPYTPNSTAIQWTKAKDGIEKADIYDEQLPLIVHALKVDLQNPHITVITSESALFTDTQGTIRAETTRTFAKRHHTTIAFNAAVFQTDSMLFSRYRKIIGLHISNYRQMSPPNKNFGAILFFDDGTAKIIDSQKAADIPPNTVCAVSGFWTILRNGAIIPSHVKIRDSRIIVGLADEGRTLFIVAVEAENTKKSQGLTYNESALLMKKIGADDALQLDGGGSTTVIFQKNGKQHIIAPTIAFFPLRRVASNVGILYTNTSEQ